MFTCFNGDCLDYLNTLSANSIDLIITDPPYVIEGGGGKNTRAIYGGTFSKVCSTPSGKYFNDIPDISLWLPLFYRVLKEGSHCYIMVNKFNLHKFLDVIETSDFHLVQVLVWDKVSKIMSPFAYMNQIEFILFLRKGAAKKLNNISISNLLSFPLNKHKKDDGSNFHDTEKPVGLMEVLVSQSSNEGDLVLDPFMGIGSTGVACVKNNRRFIGCEIVKDYFDCAELRLKDAVNSLSDFSSVKQSDALYLDF